MRLFINIFTALLFVIPANAANNVVDNAINLAKKFCESPFLKKTGAKSSSQLRSASVESPSYFIFSDNTSDKFCIVSGDGEKVLGYGDNYSDELPPQLQEALDMYSNCDNHNDGLRSATVRENIPAFMDVVFGTRSPYNKFIPDREGYGPPVGCVPVCLAQICKYYDYPSHLKNDIPAYAHYSATNPDTIYHIEGQKAEGRTYDWNLILNNYPKDTTDELNNEIAKLMWDCARSVETAFEQAGSSALTDMFVYSAIHYFGFNSDSIKIFSRDLYYREAWLDIIHDELSKKHPIYMSGSSYSNGGHAFICDGYVDGFLHINWGWNGSNNGYFDVDILDYKRSKDREQNNPSNGYSFFEKIIVGLVPGEGTKVYKRPKSSKSIVQTKQDGITVSTRFRSTETGFMMYASIDINQNGADEDILYAIGYADMNGNPVFMGNSKSNYFKSGSITLIANKEFDSSYIGQEIKLHILESNETKVRVLAQDTIYDGWRISSLSDQITITVPDSFDHDELIEPKAIDFLCEYADSAIVLNIGMETEMPKNCMKNLTLALVVNGDTLMVENTSYIYGYNDEEMDFKATFKNPDLDTEMTLLVMQTDNYSRGNNLNTKEWCVSRSFKPVSFKLSDCTIFSKEVEIDTIIHKSIGTKQRFEVTFSNPTPYEFYNDVYFLVDNKPSGMMVSIPAGGSTTKIIEKETPVLTNYINEVFKIYNYFDVAAEMIYTKDTFSHVFYGLRGGDETTLAIQILNGTGSNYENSFIVKSDSDTIAIQSVVIEPLNVAQLNYSLPVFVSDTDFIRLSYALYSFYDKDERFLGTTIPWDYQGRVLQHDYDGDKIISIDLKPILDTVTILPPIIIGIASSIEDTSSYELLLYEPEPDAKAISLYFKLNDYVNMKKPQYIGLCKKDGTFYAYMKLTWPSSNSLNDIRSEKISVLAVDNGIWISSDVDIPSLPIYNIEGKLISTVNLSSEASLFVALPKGVYVIGGKKVIINS